MKEQVTGFSNAKLRHLQNFINRDQLVVTNVSVQPLDRLHSMHRLLHGNWVLCQSLACWVSHCKRYHLPPLLELFCPLATSTVLTPCIDHRKTCWMSGAGAVVLYEPPMLFIVWYQAAILPPVLPPILPPNLSVDRYMMLVPYPVLFLHLVPGPSSQSCVVRARQLAVFLTNLENRPYRTVAVPTLWILPMVLLLSSMMFDCTDLMRL